MIRPYLYAIAIAAFLSISGGLYLKGRSDGRNACNTAALEAQVKTLIERTQAAERLADEHAERLRVDAEQDRLNEERANATPPNDASCLSRDAVGRVRDIR